MKKNYLQSFFIKNGKKEKVEKNSVILDMKIKPQYMFFIEKGHVGAFSSKENQLQAIFRQGDIFPFYHNASYPSKYYALTQTTLYVIPGKKVYNLIEKDKQGAWALVQALIERTDLLKKRISIITRRTVYSRVLEWILFASVRFGKQKGNIREMTLVITQTELANALATTRETVNRVFSKLEEKGLLFIKNEKIHIPSLKNLQKEISS